MLRRNPLSSLLLLAALLVLPGACDRQPVWVQDTGRADSLIGAAHQGHDYGRILFLADSLQAAGDLSLVKACYWRGYAFSRQGKQRPAEAQWTEALSQDIQDEEDLVYFARSANRLADMLLLKGEFESTLRVALPAMDKMREAGIQGNSDFANLLTSVGCCDLQQGDLQGAASYFNQAYSLFMQLIETEQDGSGNALKSAVAGLTAITEHYLENYHYADALTWVERLEELLVIYAQHPGTTQESLDHRRALTGFYRASALEGLGRHKDAAAAYDEALTSSYATSENGRIAAANYLMLARRWNEAADNYRLLDKVISNYGATMTLDNIPRFLLPKFRANFNARRNDEALATGMQICDALDSAIVWNHKDKAAELATVYHTQEIREEFVEQKAKTERERFVSSMVVLTLILIAFLLFVFLRYRSSMRLEEAYQQLETANAQAQEASRVKTAFLQQISHEIRTPLNLLSGFAQVITTPGMELDEQSREQLNTGIIDNTARITGLISKILDLSDLISTTSLPKDDQVSPEQVASDAAERSGIRTNPDIQFGIQLAKGTEDLLLRTNRQAASHVLALLLENAAKYTGKGMVTVRIISKQSFVYFLVEDTGIGVPPEDAERIFEQFVQLDDYREGTGIGLTVARSLGRRLGGDVFLDTSYTFGARFIFSLPHTDA